MELELLWLNLALLVGAYVFLFGFLKKLNEWYYVSSLGKKKNSLPPGDMGWPLIGNMLSFLKAFRSQDPDSFIHYLVLTDDEQFTAGFPSTVDKLFGKKSLHGVSDSEHKRLRRLIAAPINGHEALSMYIAYMEDIFISSLQEWVNNNDSPIEFLTEFKKTSFNVIAKIFMGSTDFMSESMTKYYTDMYRGVYAFEINIPGSTFHRAVKASKILTNLIKAHVNERRARKTDESTKKKGMIDLLFEANDEDGEKLEDEHIVNLLLAFLLAGHETTAHAVMWLAIYLYDNPEMLQKAKEEQEDIIKRRSSPQKGLTLNEIRQMTYLSKAIDETMRKNSIGFTFFRKAKVDVEINGYFIPKGWKVLTWHRAVHLNSDNYPDPKEFLPSRWDNLTPKPGSYVPFGLGSRRCPGADLTKLEISIFFHYFLLNYRFERINPKSPIRYLPTSTPIDNCLAKITKLP